ncbi:MAG: UDP-N-acetylmuramoyl-L-alanyl-D-glutamate--2,6-diaminopimelate ligase [Alphaproteobacteria bacterium]|nr:UDP-N-acetylmuramoyl-L-alanyl-D-glutamate--2,6-diaminopimelate ligase [Alphaproteobacteria bacterium]
MITLSALLEKIGFQFDAEDVPQDLVQGLTQNSKDVGQGFMFVAIPCAKTEDYLKEAFEKGARFFVIQEEHRTACEALSEDVFIFVCENARRLLSFLAKAFYGDHPPYLAAVTGTNGKSSTVSLLRQIWQSCGYEAACLGTVGLERSFGMDTGIDIPYLTTLDPVHFYKTLSYLKSEGVKALAFEASSHGLDQYRMDGVPLTVAAFTNLTQDHLDYHHAMDAYFKAKSRLFADILPEGQAAVINIDSDYANPLIEICKQRGHKVLTYSTRTDADFKITNYVIDQGCMTIDVNFMGHKADGIPLGVFGVFQMQNILCASAMAYACGIDCERIINCLPTLRSVPGRMEFLGKTKSDAMVFIDYAHTPDAMENAIQSIKHHSKGNVHIVFGCGGDRDQEKRPIMGAIAQNLADFVYVTDDNPRFEDPDFIRKQILSGAPDAVDMADRGQAIQQAMHQLKAGDILLILGKGNQDGQSVKGVMHHYSDKEEVAKWMGLC